MKGYKSYFGRVDLQVVGLLLGFHTLWFVIVGILVGKNDVDKVIIGKLTVLWFAMCVLSVVVAVWTFRRISNPGKRELWSMDLLTGLKNRNAFEVDTYNLKGKKSDGQMGIVIIDLDHLKRVNDSKGHAVGDVYIYDAAKCIRGEIKENAVAYRIGGDEFVIMVPGLECGEIEDLIHRIQKRFEEEYLQDFEEELFLSAGYAIFRLTGEKAFVEALIEADKKMYREKRKRKGAQTL